MANSIKDQLNNRAKKYKEEKKNQEEEIKEKWESLRETFSNQKPESIIDKIKEGKADLKEIWEDEDFKTARRIGKLAGSTIYHNAKSKVGKLYDSLLNKVEEYAQNGSKEAKAILSFEKNISDELSNIRKQLFAKPMNNSNIYIVGVSHVDPSGPYRLNEILRKVNPQKIGVELSEERVPETREEERKKLFEKRLEQKIKSYEKYGITLNQKQMTVLREHQDFVFNTSLFEYYTPMQYAKENANVQVELIDLSLNRNGVEDYKAALEMFSKLNTGKFEDNPEILKQYLRRSLLKSLESVDDLVENAKIASEVGYDNYHAFGDLIHMQKEFIENKYSEIKDVKGKIGGAYKLYMNIFDPKRDTNMANKIRALHSDGSKVLAVVGAFHLIGLQEHLKDLNPNIFTLNQYDLIKVN